MEKAASTASALSDRFLEERAHAGDRAARGELLRRARPPLVAFCQRYLLSLGDAEDAAHDVFASLSSGARWPTGNTRAWMYRVARNRCLDLLAQRSDGRVGAGSLSSYLPRPKTGPGTAVARAEQHERLRRHLHQLDPLKAEVLVLRYFDNLSRREIAEVLEIGEDLVRSRLSEARKELRAHMERGEDG